MKMTLALLACCAGLSLSAARACGDACPADKTQKECVLTEAEQQEVAKAIVEAIEVAEEIEKELAEADLDLDEAREEA